MGRSGEDVHRPCRIYSEKESSMDKIKKNFGFGCMRFPMIGEEIDEAQVFPEVDYFLDSGIATTLIRLTATSVREVSLRSKTA